MMLRRWTTTLLGLLLPLTGILGQAPSVAVGGGLATAYGGSGVSGSLRLEWPSHRLSPDTRVIVTGGAWVARTPVPASWSDIHRTAWGVGPQIGLGWHPGGSAWRFYAGGGLELLRSENEDPLTIQPGIDIPPLLDHDRNGARGTGPGGVLALRISAPPSGGTIFEFGVVATRHDVLDTGASWWMRYEVTLRFGGRGR